MREPQFRLNEWDELDPGQKIQIAAMMGKSATEIDTPPPPPVTLRAMNENGELFRPGFGAFVKRNYNNWFTWFCLGIGVGIVAAAFLVFFARSCGMD